MAFAYRYDENHWFHAYNNMETTYMLIALWWVLRVLSICLRGKKHPQPSGEPPIKTMAVLGSGGHTAEMIALLATLDPETYAPRDYVIATSDHTSAQKIEAFESTGRSRFASGGEPQHRLLFLPRSREVGQSYVTSVFTTLYAMLHAAVLMARTRPSLLLCNGPGTCIPICAWAFAMRLLGVQHVTIVYVESIARVQSLSLSGKILIKFVDHFLVQWPQLAEKYKGKARYIGRLC